MVDAAKVDAAIRLACSEETPADEAGKALQARVREALHTLPALDKTLLCMAACGSSSEEMRAHTARRMDGLALRAKSIRELNDYNRETIAEAVENEGWEPC